MPTIENNQANKSLNPNAWFDVFNQLTEFAFVINSDDQMVFANDALIKALNAQPEIFLAAKLRDLLAPECRLGVQKYFNQAREGKALDKIIIIFDINNEDVLRCEASVRALSAVDNKVLLLVVMRDVSKEAKTESANFNLATQVKFYHELINNLPAVIFYKNNLGAYQDCNDGLVELFGKTREVIIGRTDKQLLAPEVANKIKLQEDAMLQTGSPVIYQLRLEGGDEQKRDFLIHEAVVKTPGADVIGIVGVMMDISHEAIVSIEMNDKLAELEKINKLLVGRELKMIELKHQIKQLETKNKLSHAKSKSKK